jgi:CubicO group peptidase (beta-lactamase class C family)
LVIVKDDQVLLAKGYGVREIGKPEKVDENTLFAIGSNTKAFTATAIGLLVQEGKISWDDPVTKYLPTFQLHDPHATKLITIRDLLCHRSGLATWAGDILLLSDYPTEDIVRRLRYIQPGFGFRDGYGYSNLMFVTGGLVLSTVTGLSWDEFIKQRIFDPLGMANSVTGPGFFGDRKNIATPHEDVHGQIQTVTYRDDTNVGAAGSICASVSDIAQWLRFQLNDGCLDGKQLVQTSIIEETHTPHTLIPILGIERKLFPTRHFYAYGLGWFLNDHHGKLVIRHTGGVDGMLSSTIFIPEEKLGVAIFTNKLPNTGYLALTYYLVEKLMGIPPRDWIQAYLDFDKELKEEAEEANKKVRGTQVKETRPSLPLKYYAGTYNSLIAGDADITEKDGSLHIQLKAHGSMSGELTHWHYDTFLCKWDDPVLGESLIPFITDGQGHAAEFRVKIREDWIDPVEHVFKKLNE